MVNLSVVSKPPPTQNYFVLVRDQTNANRLVPKVLVKLGTSSDYHCHKDICPAKVPTNNIELSAEKAKSLIFEVEVKFYYLTLTRVVPCCS